MVVVLNSIMGNSCFFFCSVVHVMVPKEEDRTTVVLDVLQLTVEL